VLRLRWLLVALSVMCLVGCARKLTPERAHAVLEQIQQSRRTLTVEGELTTFINTEKQQLRADAEMQRGPGVIRLKYVSGRFAGWQIIEQDGHVWRVGPDGKPSASPFGPEPGMGLEGRADLQVASAGPAWVAGRWARRYVIVPRGEEVGRLVIAVDAKTSYPLQMRRNGPGGRLISETVYRQIKYGVAPPVRVAVPSVAEERGRGGFAGRGAKATEQALQQALGGPLLKPTYLPPGLQLQGYYSRQTRRGVLAEMRYSDGLRTLVVAQVKLPPRPSGLGANRQGRQGERLSGPRPEWRGKGPQQAGKAPGERLEGWRRPQQGGEAQGRAGRNLLRARRGDRFVIVGGDVTQTELQKVLESIPYPPGTKPGTTF